MPTPTSRERYRLPLMLAVAVAIGIVGYQVYNMFVLPGCGSSTTAQAVRDIFTDRDVEVLSLGAFRDLGDVPEGKLCEATIESPDETARIAFLIGWDGWKAFVRIETVENR